VTRVSGLGLMGPALAVVPGSLMAGGMVPGSLMAGGMVPGSLMAGAVVPGGMVASSVMARLTVSGCPGRAPSR